MLDMRPETPPQEALELRPADEALELFSAELADEGAESPDKKKFPSVSAFDLSLSESERDEVLAALNKAIEDPEIAIVLMTTKIVNTCPDVVSDYKLRLSKPLLGDIPDRPGSAKIGETIDRYISEAIGIKL